MVNDIKLNAAMRNNLLSLQGTQRLMDRTQERLSTGLKVNSAIDNPSSYFTAAGLNQRAGDLEALLDSMGQGIQTLKTTDEAIKSVTSLVEQAKAVANQFAETSDATLQGKYDTQYGILLKQIDELVGDANYKGVNLLKATGTTLTVKFNELTGAAVTKLEVDSVDITTGATGLNLSANLTTATIEADIDKLTDAITSLRAYASDFGNAYSIVQNRENFTEAMVNVLTEGADKLTLADMNEESANMLSLQTRQQLGVNSLSLASQAAQSVLKLF